MDLRVVCAIVGGDWCCCCDVSSKNDSPTLSSSYVELRMLHGFSAAKERDATGIEKDDTSCERRRHVDRIAGISMAVV